MRIGTGTIGTGTDPGTAAENTGRVGTQVPVPVPDELCQYGKVHPKLGLAVVLQWEPLNIGPVHAVHRGTH